MDRVTVGITIESTTLTLEQISQRIGIEWNEVRRIRDPRGHTGKTSDDVSRSHPGARGAPGNHGPSHRRAGRPVSLAGGTGRAPPIATKTRSSTVRYAEKPLAWNSRHTASRCASISRRAR